MKEQKIIEIPEITRVEGHSAVVVDMVDGKVDSVKLDVFEGTRFFEKIVVGHKYYELPHITSRVCAICSAGHVIAAITSIEAALEFAPSNLLRKMRELIHLGMIIESHATHLFALALPDYVGACDLIEFATKHPTEFQNWSQLRKLGSAIQTAIGGRPFHPVNLQVGGLSHYPSNEELKALLPALTAGKPLAVSLAEQLMSFNPKFSRQTTPVFMALESESGKYGYFGKKTRTTDGREFSINNYDQYLAEVVVPYSHAKRSTFAGISFMVGSMARLRLYNSLLEGEAANLFKASALAKGDTNTIWNNVGQAIEAVQAIDRCIELLADISQIDREEEELKPSVHLSPTGRTVGAVECPRGTLYHSYTFDAHGTVESADMVTPSAQNTARIERDIREVVESSEGDINDALQANLETLIRAYDPCNTCATHMVRIEYRNRGN
jgi:sulfhydrogenase subunit alpha